ncbi:MAG: class I SAM-dependent methyltransferase [Chloroflexi bacterium]|nr:class I SAM-dependent methyltransferase [Chloroflexota bacterium]
MADAAHHHAPAAHEHAHSHGSDEDWHNEEFVEHWLERQEERAPSRRRHFAVIRAVIPKLPEQEFRYLNLGAGPGNLDEVLLDAFPGATATLVDFSLVMLAAARQRLERFGSRVEYVQANLTSTDWVGAVGGTFNFVVSTLAIHHLEEPRRIRELYAEVHRLLGHGGMFLNFDMVRPARPGFGPLAAWSAKDPEAGLTGRRDGTDLPGTLIEHLGWLSEAGFGNVDVLWKDLSTSLLCGVRDHVHMPDAAHSHAPTATAAPAAESGHTHSH